MIGEVIDQRFRIDREAATGGMGRIYEARDMHTGRTVALKRIISADAAATARFEREAVILAELRHPGVVDYTAHGRLPDGAPYLAMEWLEGEDLASRLASGGALSVAEVVQLGRRASSTLAAIHARGVVHRDLKPANLFLPDGDVGRVKLIDFGAAREISDNQPLTRPGQLIGTASYMAPEQVRGEEIAPAVDVWALGCVLYECLTGRPAFAASRPLAAMIRVMVDEPTSVEIGGRGVPPGMVDLIRRMLSKQPGDRPATGSELVAALGAIEIGAEPVVAQPGRVAAATTLGAATTVPDLVGERRVRSLMFGRHQDAMSSLDELRAIAAKQGARIETLARSSAILITLPAGDSPVDQAVRSALLALTLRAAAPDLALAVTTGSASADDRLPVGDQVDAAVAMLAAAAPGEIRVDAATAGLLEGRFELDAGESRCLLVRRRGVEAPRTLLGKASSWVGRRRELDGLVATFDECVDNSVARAVLVTAPAGMGKSRLAAELVRTLASRGDAVELLRGQGDSSSAGSPLVMIAPAIRRSAGIFDGEPLAARRDKLLARLSWSIDPADLPPIAGFVGEMIGVPFADHDNESLSAARREPMLLAELMKRAFCRWLDAETARSPVILLLDDLHWGDPPSVAFVDAALSALGGRPFLVLALARPEVHTAFPRLWPGRELEEMRLHALPARACGELVKSALGDAVSAELIDKLVARSQGNAFALEEVVRAAAGGAVDVLPDTVIGMVQARLAGLDVEARRILRAASVFGEVFWEGGLTALLGAGVPAFAPDEWIAQLVQLELIHHRPASRLPGQREYQFRHALVRDAAYEMLLDRDRVLGHRAAGEWLAGAGEADALILAGHFERGGDREGAIEWFRRAADQALDAHDLVAVIERAERAIAAGASGATLGGLRSVQANAAFWLARYRDAARYGSEAADLLTTATDDWFRAVGSAMISSARVGDTASFDQLLDRVERAPDAGQVHVVCLCRGAFQLVQAGLLDRADSILARIDALMAAGAALDALATAHLHDLHSVRAGSVGDYARAFDETSKAVEAFRRAGDHNNVCQTGTSVAMWTLQLGDLAGAATLIEALREEAERLGSAQGILLARFGAGFVYAHVPAQHAQARDLLQQGAAGYRAVGHRRFEGMLLCGLADVEHRMGQHEASLEHAILAVDRVAETPSLLGWALALQARALLTQGRVAEALDTASRSLAALDRSGGGQVGGTHLPPLVLGEALAASGDVEAARSAISDARERVLRRAATLDGTPWRDSYLAMPDAARTMQLAREWVDDQETE